jgi:S1-C subfamily serine protease
VRAWTANLIGLSLGIAVGGAGLQVVLPRFLPHREPPVATAKAPPLPAIVPPAPPQEQTAPAPLPQLAMDFDPKPGPHVTPPLPNIVHPNSPPTSEPEQPHKPGTIYTGTGFFVATDGSLITANHVVHSCKQIRIVSRLVQPAIAELLAADQNHDIALLRASSITPPALLSIAHAPRASGRVFVLGFPATAKPRIPDETWATLENAALPFADPRTDPRNMVWLDSTVITHGYSGGPMLDPSTGTVVGIVRGDVDSRKLHAKQSAIPEQLVIGPGTDPLSRLLQHEVGGAYLAASLPMTDDDALDTARRATVHVLCLPL